MNKKNNVVKNEGYKRSFRQSGLIPCSNFTFDEGKYCVNKITKEKTLKKRNPCASDEDIIGDFCYQKCRPGFIARGKDCIITKLTNQAMMKKAFDAAGVQNKINREKRIAATGGRYDTFTNVANEWLNYNKIDKSLSDLFDGNLKQYRWFFVGALLIVAYFVIVNLLKSATVPVPVQQPTIVLQVPSNSLQVPQQVLQPALQVAAPQMIQIPEAQISPMKSEIPIKITDLKKTGGFNTNLFSDIETNIFSEWNESD